MMTVLKACTEPRSTCSQDGSTPGTGGVGAAPAVADPQRVVRLPSTAFSAPRQPVPERGGVVVVLLHAFCELLEVASLSSARLIPGGASVSCAALIAGALAALLTVTVNVPTLAALIAGMVKVMMFEVCVLLTSMVALPPLGVNCH